MLEENRLCWAAWRTMSRNVVTVRSVGQRELPTIVQLFPGSSASILSVKRSDPARKLCQDSRRSKFRQLYLAILTKMGSFLARRNLAESGAESGSTYSTPLRKVPAGSRRKGLPERRRAQRRESCGDSDGDLRNWKLGVELPIRKPFSSESPCNY